jgi:inhibitor of KinA
MTVFSIFSLGDQAITISFGNSISEEVHDRIISLKHWVEQNKFVGFLDVIASYSSLTIVYDLFVIKSQATTSAFDFVKEFIETGIEQSLAVSMPPEKHVRVPVCYEDEFAPDMVFLCDARKLTREEVIEIHSGKKYKVYMVGFLPGFAYMAEVDQRIAVPRKLKPRDKIQAGSVGIAGIQTGIYPLNSPGGWQIIGRTPLKLFVPDRDVPVTIEAGDLIEFFPISKKEFAEFENK